MELQLDRSDTLLIVVKGASDVGSAIAHALKGAGWHPIVLEGPDPGATRRRMAFAPAIHEGRAELEGLVGVRCPSVDQALARRLEPGVVPVLVVDKMDPVEGMKPLALVDARMRKRSEPPVQLSEAPLTLGIGPRFVCGEHVLGVIESNWGSDMGRVLWSGASQAYTGRHRVIEGYGRERYVYASHTGRFRTQRQILERVQPGDVVGSVDGVTLRVELGGVVRGLAYDGHAVVAGAKLVEIDPTGEPARSIGIGERQGAIAAGVVQAVRQWTKVAG